MASTIGMISISVLLVGHFAYDILHKYYLLHNMCFPQSVRSSRSSEQLPQVPPLSASPGESFSLREGIAWSGGREKVRCAQHTRSNIQILCYNEI